MNPNIRKNFPILSRKINGKNLIYFDNAATTQKPIQVIDAISNFYKNHNANIHRGVHTLSVEATDMFEKTREHTAKFINARSSKEIVFTKNATESINLVMYSFLKANLTDDDDYEVIVSELEHHSNLVPWQILTKSKDRKLKVIPVTKDLTLNFKAYKKLFNSKTKLVALTGMSNAIGTIPDIKRFIDFAHEKDVPILIDGTQLIAHKNIDVQKLEMDFLVFSAHKMLGPTGVGILYSKEETLKNLNPFLYGGDMIKTVSQHETLFADAPTKFEAGTPNIADIVAFDEALNYLENIGMANIHNHEIELLKLARTILEKFPEVTMYNAPLDETGGILSFNIKGVHAHDVASIFDNHGIAIRSGHHCAEPLMKILGVESTARMSFYLYNTEDEVLEIEDVIKEIIRIFK